MSYVEVGGGLTRPTRRVRSIWQCRMSVPHCASVRQAAVLGSALPVCREAFAVSSSALRAIGRNPWKLPVTVQTRRSIQSVCATLIPNEARMLSGLQQTLRGFRDGSNEVGAKSQHEH